MSAARRSSGYKELVNRTTPPPPPPKTVEDELDALVAVLRERERESAIPDNSDKPDPIQVVRDLTRTKLMGIFLDLEEKYSQVGVSMKMDASDFLAGGREIRFKFSLGEYRMTLDGTVTSEAIAFQETRYAPDVRGELTSGPMLRLRHLDGNAFRAFLCERLTVLLRMAMRQQR